MEGEDDVFEIESILESSVKKGIRYYRVRWKGFNENDDTWEPEENLFGCKDVLDQYWKKNKKTNQTKVKKRKSESTNQTQSTKAKKKKSGRTTNNSTIARIDSGSSPDEKIVLPDGKKKRSSIKHSRTKRKRGTDDEVRLKMDHSDSSQENESSNKNKKTIVKKKKQKKVVDKDSSLKSELEQPFKIKKTLDENENTKDIEQIVPEQTTSFIAILDEADNATVSKVKPVALQRENSRESLGGRSMGVRRSWSSYEASPEFVPEYCDETLTYHMGSEEEFGYFGDTGFFVKDSVGYQESNCFEPTEKLPTDEPFVENDNLVDCSECHVKDDDNLVKDGEGHAEDDEVHVKDEEDHVKDSECHVKDDDNLVKDGVGHAEDDKVHVKDVEDHVKDGEDHVKDGEDHVKDGEGHAKGGDVYVKGDEDHVNDGKSHAESGECHAKGDDVCVKDDKEPVKRDKDHVKNNKDHIEDDENHVKDDKEHVKNNEEHVKDDENQIKDDEEHVKDDAGLAKDAEVHVKDSKDKVNAISPVKEVRTEGEKQGVSLPETELSYPACKDESISDHSAVLIGKEEGLKCVDNNTDLLNCDGDTAPKLNTEESGSKTVRSNDTEFNEGLSDAGDEVEMLGHVRTQKTSDLKLKMTLGSSEDSAGFTDSECLSPEFVRLPEPQKDYFESVFAERMGEENVTHTLTCEKGSKESKFIDCKDELNNTEAHGNDSCEDTKKEASTKMELHKSTSTVVVNNSNVTLAEQSGKNASNDEKLHCDTNSGKKQQILEHKTPKCAKTKSLEGKCDEKNFTQTKIETVSSTDDLKEQTCPSACLSPIDKQRKLSEEETAHCLLDLSSVRISGSQATKINFPSSNQETSCSIVDMDFNKSGKLESGKEIIDDKRPLANSGKNKNVEKRKPHAVLKKKMERNNSERKKVKLLLNLPFIDQGSKEVLGILDNAMKPTQGSERDSKGKCLSSTGKTIALATVREEATTSKTTKESRSEMKEMSTSPSCDKKSNDSSQTAAKSLKTSTDKHRTSSIRPNECQIKQTVTSNFSVNTASRSSVKQNLPLSVSESNLPHPDIGQQQVSGLPLFKELLPSGNTSEKKPEVIVKRKIENKSENEQNTDTHTASSVKKNQSGSSKQGLTKVSEVLTPVNDEKHSLPRHTQAAEESSNSVLIKQNLDSHGKTIVHVYGRGRYEGPSQENESWSSDTMKTHSAHFSPTSLSCINPILYSDSPGANTFVVSHLNQKGFSMPPGSFHFNQQPFPNQPNIHAHQKPFSAVAGFNWYPENRPRQMGLAIHRAIAPKPFYYVPAFPVSSPYSRQATPDNLYTRALQEMAKKRQPESSTQPAPTSFTSNPYSSPVDADKAWYAKHVGNINTATSLNNVKSSLTDGEGIKTPTSKSQAEIETKITSDTSDTIKANKDHFSSVVTVTRSPEEKAGTNSPSVETKKKDSCLAERKESFTGEGFECFENKSSTTSSLSKSKTSSSTANSGLTASQEMVEVSSTGIAIAQSEGKAIDKKREKDKNKDIEKGKSEDKFTTKSNQKSISHSKPDSKESSLKDVKNKKQRKTASEKLENRSSGNRSKISSKERYKDSSIDLKKEKKGDFEKSRDTEISRKREESLKTDSRSEQDDRRSRHDSKGKELKREDWVDSEVEFDLDDYSPGEVVVEKVEKMTVSHSGIPSAMSLREVKTAIKRGDSATVLASLAGGMNIDSQDTVSGMTLLMRAVSFGQENIVRLLLNHGANINIKDSTGSTPLIAACEQGFENIVSLLLNAEIDINAKQTLSGETALIKACVNGYYSIVAMLLAQGADCQMRSVSGLNAAQLAVQSGHFEIRDLLESHGKKLQRCVETAIASCLCDSSRLMYPPLLPFVSLYPAEGQKFTYHFHCSKLLLSKTVLLFCLRAVFSRSGQVDLSFSKDNGVHTVLLNSSLQSPVLSNNKSVFVLQPKLDTNRLILQTYQSHVHLLVCIYAAELDEGILNIEPSTMAV